MLELPDHWVWDSWYIQVGPTHHAFFLRASRALIDPDLRHRRATVGHATSTDLKHWQLQPDALTASDGPAFDDLAVWTGSTIKGPDGRWHMFYTGISRAHDSRQQAIGLAISDDLITWHRYSDRPLVLPDPRWYQTTPDETWPEATWRDPWVYADPHGAGWHMLVTARGRKGPADERGVIGHATSSDLTTWTVAEPLSVPAGFAELEVVQTAHVGGEDVLLFSVPTRSLAARRIDPSNESRVFVARTSGAAGHYDIEGAVPLQMPGIYAPRLIQHNEDWYLIGFEDGQGADFGGRLCDPIRVATNAEDEQEGAIKLPPSPRRPEQAIFSPDQ